MPLKRQLKKRKKLFIWIKKWEKTIQFSDLGMFGKMVLVTEGIAILGGLVTLVLIVASHQ